MHIPVSDSDCRLKNQCIEQVDNQLGDKYIRVLKDGYVSMDMAQNILVMKTVSGMAMAVAASVVIERIFLSARFPRDLRKLQFPNVP